MPDIDHRTMEIPFLRTQRRIDTAGGNAITFWDLRLSQPNVSSVAPAVLHSLEHFLNVYFETEGADAHVSLLGCQTGLYITTVNVSAFDDMAALLEPALKHILGADEVPLATEIHCGAAALHDLVGAQRVAAWLLSRRADWGQAAVEPSYTPTTWKDNS